MKTFTKFLAIAALSASPSTMALAQADVGVDVGGDAEVEAGVDAPGKGDGSANANANADIGAAGDVNYGQIVSGLRTSNIAAADIEALGADAQIDIVTTSEIQGEAAENASALDEAVSAQASALAELTAAIEANADVAAALEAEGFTVDQIVAVTSSGEGNLTIIVDDAV